MLCLLYFHLQACACPSLSLPRMPASWAPVLLRTPASCVLPPLGTPAS